MKFHMAIHKQKRWGEAQAEKHQVFKG